MAATEQLITKVVDGVNPNIEATVKAVGSDNAVVTTGSIITGNTLITAAFDYIGVTYPTTSSEVYTYKTGGAGGTTVGTITVLYSDAVTKQIISSVTKT